MKKILTVGLVTAVALTGAAAETNVTAALRKGAAFLLTQQKEDGHFSDAQMPALTALPLWALTGVGGVDKAVREKAAKFVLGTQRDDGGFYVPKPGRGGSGLGNYNTAVCLSALFESKLADLLKAKGFVVARRTIAKYRALAGIPGTSERRDRG